MKRLLLLPTVPVAYVVRLRRERTHFERIYRIAFRAAHEERKRADHAEAELAEWKRTQRLLALLPEIDG